MTSFYDDTEGWPYREGPASAYRPPDDEPDLEPNLEPAVEPEESELPFDLEAEIEQSEPEPLDPDLAEAVVVPEEEAVDDSEEASDEVPVAEQEEREVEHAVGDLGIPDGYGLIEGSPGGGRRTVGIVVGRFNGEITNALLHSALDELEEAGIERDAVTIMPVPGAFELPLAAMALAKTRRYACVIALGCVIRGETPHFDFVAGEAASGLQLAAVETGVPVSFGVLTCETRDQAEARVGKGAEAVRAGLEMADVFAQLRAQARS